MNRNQVGFTTEPIVLGVEQKKMYKRAEELETGEASFSLFPPLLLIQNGRKLFLKFFIPQKTRLLGQSRNLVGKVFFGKIVKGLPIFIL